MKGKICKATLTDFNYFSIAVVLPFLVYVKTVHVYVSVPEPSGVE